MYIKKIFILFILTLSLVLFTQCQAEKEKSKILIIGDSISKGYGKYVQKSLKSIAEIKIISENGRDTGYGISNIHLWIGEDNWDIIIFNWGLWDICFRSLNESNELIKDKMYGIQQTNLNAYSKNLEHLLLVIKETTANPIFITTTFVPEGEPGMNNSDVVLYNEIAKSIMNLYSIQIIDLYDISRNLHEKFCLAENNVHYTKSGYKKLGQYISEHIILTINNMANI